MAESFRSVAVVVYPRGYFYKVRNFDYTDKAPSVVPLEKVTTDTDFLQNVRNYWSLLSKMQKRNHSIITDPDQKAWLKGAYREFEKEFQHSREDRRYVIELVEMLKLVKEPEAVNVLQRAIAKYPDDNAIGWFYKNNITSMKTSILPTQKDQ